ncbi:MAG: hypothetical protein ABW190_09660 [Rhizobacter sp.]
MIALSQFQQAMFLRGLSGLLVAATLAVASAHALAATPDSAAALRERHAQMAPEMARSAFQRPMAVQSSESGTLLQGSVDAVLPQAFALARDHLQRPEALCEILMLQINTKQCAVNSTEKGHELVAHIGRKSDQPVADAYRVAFTMQPLANTPEHMSLRLGADTGPFSTRDFRIQLQAIPLDGGQRTYLHLSYSYGIGLPAKLAMQGYLATAGSSKVGFTRTAGDGYIGGMRGAIERNTMRYYLAIEAYLASLSAPEPQQRALRLERWFASTEQYARQLHELDRADYIAMKQREFRRMAATG